ncbi:increased DNA methylation 1-like isoform X2 [Diospyros lotus]|uniref:increased DNA methylation 1-like isoform X2 n=1 Tax=Diospyros lotus TaxID=55363 RepID=UPI002253A40B|nr:increased DNA methylation 1-like isoform X2 [Diospyros lotus]
MLLNVEVNECSPVNDLATPAIKLELKMSKKVALGRIPSTVKELLATGLLEGYSVSCKRGKTELRGIIKGAGILCFCSTCKGSRVVKPGQFEVHACKSKTRCAPYYIRLENGKNLLQVLRACRMSPLDVLEETIQSTICPLPESESIICQNCQGSFLPTFAEKLEQLCPSCVGLKNSEAGIPTHATNANARLSKAVSARKSPTIASACISLENKIRPTVTKKDQQMHKLVFEHGGLPDGTEVGYYSRGQKLLVGYKKGMGIFCLCCNSEVSPSQFEAHAGWASRKKPYGYIYTSNGVSLHEYAVSLLKGRKHPSKENDDLCSICADGGNLLLCDGCPRAFHIECASLSSIPHGIWYCQYCQNMFQREKFVEHNANAVAAGRVSGIDPIEEITKRCIRIVKNPEDAEVIACVLCRGSDFTKSGFGPQTVIVCDQCEKEYHVGCLKEHKMADLKKLPKGKWFCCMGCRMTYSALQNLLTCGEEKIQDSLLDVIKKKHEDKVPHMVSDFDVRWRVLNGKIASRETRMLLSKAVAIFHECFDPIVDSGTGRDLIPSMVYGRSSRGQDFGGMYCAVLMVNSSIVSAGIFRLFGQEIAELPLVATSNDNQGKGYFQILFSCIEKLLASFNVKNLVLPAADQAVSIWTDKFGFERIPPEQLSNYNKTYGQMMTFKGTCMLQKVIPR